ncbi:MAG TPA: hypothetical protein VFB84_18585, partial [Micromonosporaceae bacterium]|nr:hypothetical protein [Micromonosporaceae bacterium]
MDFSPRPGDAARTHGPGDATPTTAPATRPQTTTSSTRLHPTAPATRYVSFGPGDAPPAHGRLSYFRSATKGEPVEDRFAAEAIASDISAYTELGDHRTGWPADNAVSDWLVAELQAAGLTAEQVSFSFPLVQPEPSWVGIGGRRVTGAPLYDGGVTGPNGVAGRLTDDATHADGGLLVLRDAPIAAHGRGTPWAEARPAGVILISGDPEGAVLHRNAERIDRPFQVPVLQVARRDATPIEAAISTGDSATLVVRTQRMSGTATNVVAALPATTGQADEAIVLMTPKSGWGPCAAERSDGIVIELALARHLAALPERRREVRCLFTGGHELAHYGLCSLLRDRPALGSG